MKDIDLIKRITSSFVVLLFVIQLSNGRVLVGNETNNIHKTQKKETCTQRCVSGECIESDLLCDGFANCKDSSDETEEQCSRIICPGYTFRCKYGACISKDKICDGTRDCADNSDEEDIACSTDTATISISTIVERGQTSCEFTCGSGECLEEKFLCDGKPDCVDGSDEASAYCAILQRVTRADDCSSETHSTSSSSDSAGNTINKSTSKVTTKCISPNSTTNIIHNYKLSANLTDLNATEISKLIGSADSDGIVQLPPHIIHSLLCDEKTVRDLGLNICSLLDPSQLAASTKVKINNFEQLPQQEQCAFDDPNKFRCGNAKCIPKTARCNGVSDCTDGSDEIGCPSKEVEQPSQRPPSAGCLLPVHLSDGKYHLSSGKPYSENAAVDSLTIINLVCDVGYASTEIRDFFCSNNVWVPNLNQGHCIRTCTTLSSTDTFDASCNFRGQSVSCDNPKEGTVATINCKPFYVYRGTRSKLVCESNGMWDPYPTPCEPECGRKIVNTQTFVIGGSDSLPGEYPWIAGVYNTSMEQKKYICAGSIISRLYILSAAHCFSDQKGTPYPEDYFTVAAGKHHRAFDFNENDIQLRKVKKLYIHRDYKGSLQKYRDDIALIKVDKLEMTETVRLICLDWQNRYEDTDLKENRQGVVAGWGFTQEGAAPAEVLKKLIVPFRSAEVCGRHMEPSFFEQYFASDKICAGYIDQGMSVCSGDSGGGLYFESHPATFYVRGIVSLSPRSKTGCSSNQYALYTKVSKYLPWIVEYTRAIL